MKKIIITGATGLIGKRLVKSLLEKNYELVIFSRDVKKTRSLLPGIKEIIEWNYHRPENWESYFENVYAVIHLAGTNLFAKRWDERFKKDILESRTISTRNLVNAFKETLAKPAVFISASGIGFYGNSGDELLTESSSVGNDFVAEVCKEWENESNKLSDTGIRTVQIRTGLVLCPEDGALKQMLPAFRSFVGGPLGNGKQWSSWVHIEDIVKIYLYALENSGLSGPLNAVSPEPVKMKDLAGTLGKVLNRPAFFRVPQFALRIIIGEASGIITASQKVFPDKLLKSGFQFKFSNLEFALTDLLK